MWNQSCLPSFENRLKNPEYKEYVPAFVCFVQLNWTLSMTILISKVKTIGVYKGLKKSCVSTLIKSFREVCIKLSSKDVTDGWR